MSSMPPVPPQPPFGNPAPLNYSAPPARNDLREIAVRQKAIQFCVLAYIVFGILIYVVPPPLNLICLLAVLASIITGAVFVFMLAIAIYSTAAGIILGILTLIPFVGLIILLVVNGKVTGILRANGISVGLLGAKTSQIPSRGVNP